MRRGAAPSSVASGSPAAIASASHSADVERRQRHAHDARDADQRKAPLQRRRRCAIGATASPLHQRDGIVQDLRDRPGAAAPIAEEIGPAGDALLRLEVDQQERRGADRRGAGAERVAHRHLDRRRANAADGAGSPRAQAAFRPSACERQDVGDGAVAAASAPRPSRRAPPRRRRAMRTSSRLPRSKS